MANSWTPRTSPGQKHSNVLQYIRETFYSADAVTASERLVSVTGAGECSDCASKNIDGAVAFNGLNVAVYCMGEKGQFHIKGVGELDKEGKFSVRLPSEIVKEEGGLKKECFAQLHGGSKNTPCPSAGGGFDVAKLVPKSVEGGKHTFVTAGKLSFSSETCASTFFFWGDHPWFKPINKFPWYFPPSTTLQPIMSVSNSCVGVLSQHLRLFLLYLLRCYML
ncbi:unnamed protein product [Spirodela intermedia]|uniref:Uncharacterized protein n=1 Tax=Spirodela intermedia TaxID=51605 RepID=A0A7I8IE32_SPIIN|nr:unnamed protein product [Spirodela intermedia]CAA6655929.1 unnamed protein product [Spirodela intermedia]